MLRVDDVEVRYGRAVGVHSVSLTLSEGETVGLIGPNGAGKTTTLAAISGLVSPSRGAIEFRGASVVGRSPERIVRGGIAMVPERRRIFATLTVEENLMVGATAGRGRLTKDDLARMVERFPVLERYLHSFAGELSGGEQQQLAIARALLAQPRLLLLDEPSLGLAPLMVDAVFEALAELRAEGVSMLLVEQNARRTIEFADRTYVLRGGSVHIEGARAEMVAREAEITKSYLGA